MSTRATYQFTGERTPGLNHSMPTVTVYIHHDGYPEGAACYFWNMHHATSYDRAPLVCFLRANERAELTESHEAHADTEYRYTLRGSFLSASHRRLSDESRQFVGFFAGELHEFVNKYGPGGVEGFTPLRKISPVYDYSNAQAHIYSRGQILAGLIKAREELASYRERFPMHTGNIGGHESTVRAWERTLDSYNAQEPAPVVKAGG